MDSLTIEIVPDSRLSKNGLRKSNWRVSQGLMKQAREDAYMLGLAEMEDDWETPEQATVEVVQYYARRPLDFDGLACIVAPTIDGLVDCGASGAGPRRRHCPRVRPTLWAGLISPTIRRRGGGASPTDTRCCYSAGTRR